MLDTVDPRTSLGATPGVEAGSGGRVHAQRQCGFHGLICITHSRDGLATRQGDNRHGKGLDEKPDPNRSAPIADATTFPSVKAAPPRRFPYYPIETWCFYHVGADPAQEDVEFEAWRLNHAEHHLAALLAHRLGEAGCGR